MPILPKSQIPPHGSQPHSQGLLVFLGLCVVLSMIFSGFSVHEDVPVVIQGPALANIAVTKSILDQGSLNAPYFTDIYHQVTEASRAQSATMWQDVFALGVDGKLYPKHSPISSFFAVPFYSIFGELGFWVMQQLSFFVVLVSLYLLARRETKTPPIIPTTIAALVLSPTLFYSYSFSYDLHGCALLLGGLCLGLRSQFLGGLIMSLAIFVRPTYILLAAPLSIAHLTTTPRKNIANPFLGLALGCLLFALYNTLLFGGPFVTAYARLPIFINGEPHLWITPAGFDPQVFLSDWSKKVWSDAGLLPLNSGLLLLPLTLRVALRSRYRSFHVTCLIVALIYTLYVFSYPMWSATSYGNRFLLPAVQLYLVPLIVALENFSSRSLRPVHGKQPDAGELTPYRGPQTYD